MKSPGCELRPINRAESRIDAARFVAREFIRGRADPENGTDHLGIRTIMNRRTLSDAPRMGLTRSQACSQPPFEMRMKISVFARMTSRQTSSE